MMLQYSGPSLADISCSALVPCLSPPGSLTLDDFTNFTPMVKEELRLAIQTKRLSNGLSVDMSSDGASSSSDRAFEEPARGSGVKREVRGSEGEPNDGRGGVASPNESGGLLLGKMFTACDSLWFPVDGWGARQEEEEEGEEQGRCRKVSQQEEGEDRDSAAGTV